MGIMLIILGLLSRSDRQGGAGDDRAVHRHGDNRTMAHCFGVSVAAALFDAHPLDEFFDVSTWLTAIVGAIVLFVIYRLAGSRGHGLFGT